MSVNTPLRELILINVGRVNGIMQTIAEDVGNLAAENTRLRVENAELRAGQGRWPEEDLEDEPVKNVSMSEEPAKNEADSLHVTAEQVEAAAWEYLRYTFTPHPSEASEFQWNRARRIVATTLTAAGLLIEGGGHE